MLARALQTERDAVVLVADQVVRPGDQGDEVRRQRLGALELPRARAPTCVPGALPMHRPVVGARHVQGVRRLQVGLVEAGEDASARRP